MAVIESFRGEHAFLSNFHPSPIIIMGDLYMTVEHAYQAAKAFYRSDAQKIRAMDTPGKAKAAGRTIAIVVDWERIRIPTMRYLLSLKFSEPSLAARLKETGDAEIVEVNTWNDTFWGKIPRGDRLEGRNMLGLLLMDIRGHLP